MEPVGLLKVTLLRECFSRSLNFANGIKSREASNMDNQVRCSEYTLHGSNFREDFPRKNFEEQKSRGNIDSMCKSIKTAIKAICH